MKVVSSAAMGAIHMYIPPLIALLVVCLFVRYRQNKFEQRKVCIRKLEK